MRILDTDKGDTLYPWEAKWKWANVQYYPEKYPSVIVMEDKDNPMNNGIYRITSRFGFWPKGIPVYEQINNRIDKRFLYWNEHLSGKGWDIGTLPRNKESDTICNSKMITNHF